MTAAIVVNDRLAATAGKGKTSAWQPRTADELNHLTVLAEASVGFDKTRGDLVSVQDLAFDDNRAPAPVSLFEQWLRAAESSPVLVKYAALLAGLVFLIFFAVRPALKQSATPRKPSAKALPASEPQPALHTPEAAEIDAARVRSQEIFQEVTAHLKREPTQSSRLLQSWIHTEQQ